MAKLKYLFQAEYKDGTLFDQNHHDTSVTDPQKSAYFDVKQDQLKSFHLIGNGNKFTVNLEDGHFEVNGVPFAMHEEPLSNFRLIFFREHTHIYNVSSSQEQTHTVVYLLGWQTTHKGKNIKRVMRI